MRKSKYLIINSFYFDFNNDLTDIINVKKLFKNQTVLDLERFNDLKIIKFNVFSENQIKHLRLPKNIEIIGEWAFENNKIEILDLSNCNNLNEIDLYAFSNNPLQEIKILNKIIVSCSYSQNLSYDAWDKFAKYYNDNNKKEGNYKLENNEWKWYPL